MSSKTGLSAIPPQNHLKDEITYVTGDLHEYYDNIINIILSEMLVNEYSKEAPVTKAVGAKSDEIRESYLAVCKDSLKSPYSILPFVGEKCIGWVTNYIKTDLKECKEDPSLTFNNDFTERIANKGFNEKSSKIAVVMDEIERNFTYFIPDCKKLFVLDVVFVQPSYAGKGIATKLTKKAIQLARDNQCDYIMSISTNIKSAHIFTKFGFKCVREIAFHDFHQNGQSFLHSKDENKSVRLMFLKL